MLPDEIEKGPFLDPNTVEVYDPNGCPIRQARYFVACGCEDAKAIFFSFLDAYNYGPNYIACFNAQGNKVSEYKLIMNPYGGPDLVIDYSDC